PNWMGSCVGMLEVGGPFGRCALAGRPRESKVTIVLRPTGDVVVDVRFDVVNWVFQGFPLIINESVWFVRLRGSAGSLSITVRLEVVFDVIPCGVVVERLEVTGAASPKR